MTKTAQNCAFKGSKLNCSDCIIQAKEMGRVWTI